MQNIFQNTLHRMPASYSYDLRWRVIWFVEFLQAFKWLFQDLGHRSLTIVLKHQLVGNGSLLQRMALH